MSDNKPYVHLRDANGRLLPGQPALPGAGRPKGAKTIHSRGSVKKLAELGIDPLEELKSLYDTAMERGDVDLAFKVMNRLVDFGYSKTATMSEQRHEGAIPVMNIARKPKDDEGETLE